MDKYSAQEFHEDCVSLTLPHLIDKIAERDPNRVFVSLLRDNFADGYEDYSYQDFARAIDKCAWWIDGVIGKSVEPDTVAYIGPQDLRQTILVLAALKTGRKLQCFNPLLTVDQYLSLMRDSDCKVLFFSQSTSVADQVVSSVNLPRYSVPSLSLWLDSSPVLHYMHQVPMCSSSTEPFCVVHTSGTTGPPKPYILTHAIFNLDHASYSHLHASSSQDTVLDHFRGLRVLAGMPMSISPGLHAVLGENVVHDFVIVLPPSWTRLTPDLSNNCLTHGNVQACITSPLYFRELAHTPQYLDNISRLTYLAFTGAPCPEATSILSTRTRVTALYGSTECGSLPLILTDPEDWAYMHIHPMLCCDFRHVCQDLYEIVITRNDQGSSAFQAVFELFPQLEEYKVNDLFSRHPSKTDTWLYRGRREDLTRTSDGDMFLPKQMEATIEAHPVVDRAIICDMGKAGLALVVELITKCAGNERKLMEQEIFEAVQRANGKCPVKPRVRRELVLWMDKWSMPRGTKGFPLRSKVVEKFSTDIRKLYSSCEEVSESML